MKADCTGKYKFDTVFSQNTVSSDGGTLLLLLLLYFIKINNTLFNIQ
jgi:hypothetical protein